MARPREFDEDEVPFIEANTADVLPEALTEFLFEWQIRESSSDADEARTTRRGSTSSRCRSHPRIPSRRPTMRCWFAP